MNEQEVREFEENIVKGANIAFQRLVNQKKKEDGELVFSRNGHIFRVKAVPLCLSVYLRCYGKHRLQSGRGCREPGK